MVLVNLKSGDKLVEKYEIIKALANGDSSTIYLARELTTESHCVIKELWGGRLPEEEKNIARETFDQEVRVLRALRHPGIPTFYDSFSVGIWHYLVMEYIKGKTLQEIVEERKNPVLVDSAILWAIQICDILYFLHNRATPVIFRNLSPSNVMLTHKGDIKLIDFGLARFFDDHKSRDTHVLGTFGFAAPEQYGKTQTTPSTDIYSLGTTLYYLLTLQNIQEFLFNFPPIRKFNARVPQWLEKTITRCLEKYPEKRHKDALTLKSEMEKGYGKIDK